MQTRPDADLLVATVPRQAVPQAYGWFTRIARPLLVLAIVGTVMVIFMWPNENESLPKPAPIKSDQVAQTANDLIAPKFSSVDEQGNPFTLTAARATQVAGKPDLVDLDAPTGEIKLASGMDIHVKAPSGVYDQNAKILDLSGGVDVTTNDGYHMTTDHVRLDIQAEQLTSETEVQMNGPLGSLVAPSLRVDGKKNILILNGPATLILNEGI